MTKDNIPTGVAGLKLVRWVLSSKEALREFAATFGEAVVVTKDRPITQRSKLAPRLSVSESDEVSTDEFCSEMNSKKGTRGSTSNAIHSPMPSTATLGKSFKRVPNQLSADTEASSVERQAKRPVARPVSEETGGLKEDSVDEGDPARRVSSSRPILRSMPVHTSKKAPANDSVTG